MEFQGVQILQYSVSPTHNCARWPPVAGGNCAAPEETTASLLGAKCWILLLMDKS